MSDLTFHYSNPKFDGKPWAIDHTRKAKQNPNKKKLRKWRKKVKAAKLVNPHEGKVREFLETFWGRFELLPNTAMRLDYLRRAATPDWNRVDDLLRKRLRREFLKKYRYLLSAIDEHCGVCGDNVWKEKHHIIPLAFGGINSDLNLLAICRNCHDAIHPWLATPLGG